MSYRPHRLNEFIPNYIPHSDYLPSNNVTDDRQLEVQPLVNDFIFSSSNTKLRDLVDMSTLKNHLSLTPEDTYQSERSKR
jgi:hypothetical protein